MAAPLVEGTTYYVIRVSDSLFQLSATEGGAAINLTTAGDTMLVSIELPFDAVIEGYSRWAEDCCPGHLVPFTPGQVPMLVRMTVAELAGKKLMQLCGHTSESVNEYELAAKAKLERWGKGIPLRDADATASANLSVTASLSATQADPRGWGAGGIP